MTRPWSSRPPWCVFCFASLEFQTHLIFYWNARGDRGLSLPCSPQQRCDSFRAAPVYCLLPIPVVWSFVSRPHLSLWSSLFTLKLLSSARRKCFACDLVRWSVVSKLWHTHTQSLITTLGPLHATPPFSSCYQVISFLNIPVSPTAANSDGDEHVGFPFEDIS